MAIEDKITPNRYKLFTVGAIGTFMATLDGSILNVALPTIAKEFNVNIDIVAWVVLAYSLTLVTLLMVFGAWASRKGYDFAYKFGYIFFTSGSIICAFSSSITMLLIGRVVQAIGASMVQAVGPGMITEVFPSKQRGKGIGLMVMMVSAGLMCGPPLGGFLLSIWSWQSIFIINIPIGLIGLALTFKYFKVLKPKISGRKVPLIGAFAISVGLLAGMLLTSIFIKYPISDFRIWGLFILTIISVYAFYRIESNPEKALIGIDIFSNRQFTTSIISMLTMFIAMSGVLILVPFYLEQVKFLEPKSVGLYLMILPISMFIFAPISGKLSDKIGYRFLTSLGLLLLISGLYLLSNIKVDSPVMHIINSLILVGVGVGIFNTPNSSALMGSVTPQQRTIASGIIGTTRNIGMSFGIALATGLFTYFNSIYLPGAEITTAFVQSYQNVAYVAIAIAALGLPFCLVRKNTV